MTPARGRRARSPGVSRGDVLPDESRNSAVRPAPSLRHVAEERDAESASGLGQHGAECRHLEHATDGSDLGLAHLWNAVKDELDGLLIEWSDGERAAGDPAILIGGRQVLGETLLDADDQLVQRCGQHVSR